MVNVATYLYEEYYKSEGLNSFSLVLAHKNLVLLPKL